MVANILMALGIAALLYFLYQGVKQNKEAFTGENLNKSFMTMGILALLLIVLVALTVMALRHH